MDPLTLEHRHEVSLGELGVDPASHRLHAEPSDVVADPHRERAASQRLGSRQCRFELDLVDLRGQRREGHLDGHRDRSCVHGGGDGWGRRLGSQMRTVDARG